MASYNSYADSAHHAATSGYHVSSGHLLHSHEHQQGRRRRRQQQQQRFIAHHSVASVPTTSTQYDCESYSTSPGAYDDEHFYDEQPEDVVSSAHGIGNSPFTQQPPATIPAAPPELYPVEQSEGGYGSATSYGVPLAAAHGYQQPVPESAPLFYPSHHEYIPPVETYAPQEQYAPPQQYTPPQQYAPPQQFVPLQQFMPLQQYASPHQYAPPQQYALPQQHAPSQQYAQPPHALVVPTQSYASSARATYSSAPSTSSTLANALGSPIISPRAELPRDRDLDSGSVASGTPGTTASDSPAATAGDEMGFTFVIENTPQQGRSGEAASLSAPVGALRKKRSPPKGPRKEQGFLACFFCRGRKIACNVPPSESGSTTCEQCAKRHLVCEFPTESRRGQRGLSSTGRNRSSATTVSRRERREAHLDAMMQQGQASTSAAALAHDRDHDHDPDLEPDFDPDHGYDHDEE